MSFSQSVFVFSPPFCHAFANSGKKMAVDPETSVLNRSDEEILENTDRVINLNGKKIDSELPVSKSFPHGCLNFPPSKIDRRIV